VLVVTIGLDVGVLQVNFVVPIVLLLLTRKPSLVLIPSKYKLLFEKIDELARASLCKWKT
jgi:hypothetical protein